MRRSPLLGVAASLCLVLGVAACGGDDGDKSEADIKQELSETLQADGSGFDEATADCYADIIIDEVGADELRGIDLSASEPPAELQEAITAAAVRAGEECDLSG